VDRSSRSSGGSGRGCAHDGRSVAFDYERHLRVYVATDVPLPSPTDARLALDALIDYLEFCTLRVRGGSLVLFTSYHDLRRCAEALEPVYEKARRPFHLQGGDASRTELTRLMRAEGNAILSGPTVSGPGSMCPGRPFTSDHHRLPFDVPTHPVAQARAEWIREHDGNRSTT